MTTMRAWKADGSPAIGEGKDEELSKLLGRCLSALLSGRAVDTEGLVARHPHLTARLRSSLEGLEACVKVLNQAGEAKAEDGISPSPGLVLGDFRIGRELGRGGMGIVYLAEQVSLQRTVALKVLPFTSTLQERQIQRFKNEACAAAQLQHAHIVPVYSVGCENGLHYFAMKYIEGKTLEQVLRDAPAVQWRGQALGWMAQAADALHYAHSKGVVHRDIKPSNLLIDAAGRLWVADFGLARVKADSSLTLSGDLVGTLRYMSPEGVLGKRSGLDHRADIYSLGVTLYELLGSRPAFNGDDREQVLRKIALEEPPPLRQIDHSIPRDLETIVHKAMAREPRDRYGTAREMAEDLRRHIDDRPVLARRRGVVQRAVRWSGKRKLAVASGCTMALLSAATATLWRLHEDEGRTAAYRRKVEQAVMGIEFTRFMLCGRSGAGVEAPGAAALRIAEERGLHGIRLPLQECHGEAPQCGSPPSHGPRRSVLPRQGPPPRRPEGSSAGGPPPRPDAGPLLLPGGGSPGGGLRRGGGGEALPRTALGPAGGAGPGTPGRRARHGPAAVEGGGRRLRARGEADPPEGIVARPGHGGVPRTRTRPLPGCGHPGALIEFAGARARWPQFIEGDLNLGRLFYHLGHQGRGDRYFDQAREAARFKDAVIYSRICSIPNEAEDLVERIHLRSDRGPGRSQTVQARPPPGHRPLPGGAGAGGGRSRGWP